MRINLLAGPGAGKSTTAAWLFSELKRRNISVEHVGEYVKGWSYQKRTIHKYDQLYLFGKQHQIEYKYLINGVKHIVTDSPIILSAFYSKINGSSELSDNLTTICKLYEKDFPSFNIFLQRGDKEYIQAGRWQTKEDALRIDKEIHEFITKQLVGNFIELPFDNERAILDAVLLKIQECDCKCDCKDGYDKLCFQ